MNVYIYWGSRLWRPREAEDGRLIKADHDTEMLSALFSELGMTGLTKCSDSSSRGSSHLPPRKLVPRSTRLRFPSFRLASLPERGFVSFKRRARCQSWWPSSCRMPTFQTSSSWAAMWSSFGAFSLLIAPFSAPTVLPRGISTGKALSTSGPRIEQLSDMMPAMQKLWRGAVITTTRDAIVHTARRNICAPEQTEFRAGPKHCAPDPCISPRTPCISSTT